MKYAIGIDGGGTKTMYALADETGRLLLKYRNGCTNHYLSGMDRTVTRLQAGIRSLVELSGIEWNQIQHIHMALAGIDTPEDRHLLESALADTCLSQVPHTIENDLWIAFFAQASETYGAISICGTGHNTGVLLRDGRRICIQANRYPLGNFGGGRMLCDEALNAAYLSHEHTGEKTLLEERAALCCGCENLEELARRVMESHYTYHYAHPLPQLLEELANQGDRVSCAILANSGRRQAEMTGRLITHMGMDKEPLTVVLAGSVYCKCSNQELLNAYQEELLRHCPNANMLILDREPVEGAVLCALLHVLGDLSREETMQLSAQIHQYQPEVTEETGDE